MTTQRTHSPIDGALIDERELSDAETIDRVLARADAAQPQWARVPIAERAALCERMVAHFEAHAADIASEITLQMGRPIAHSPGEVRGLAERARHMISAAPRALADVDVGDKPGFHRFIRHQALGVVLTVAPWNYPLLTSVNSIVPALMAGNVVVLKHSAQTPLCAERYAQAAQTAGLPEGVLSVVHCSHEQVARMVADPRVDFVAFTGSVEGGHAVVRAAMDRFIGAGLELGGKDPAYVRADADVGHAVENLVDGVYFNAGQSCCGVERIYVAREVFEPFVEGFVAIARRYVLGDPRDPATSLGPMVRGAAADFVRGQVQQAVAQGARSLIDEAEFPRSAAGTPYLAPQVLIDVTQQMAVMRDESFGPVVGIMPVAGDDEAVSCMNDSRFGLTASVWTRDESAALALGNRVDTGTWFMNRCDYLDPALAWVGVKDSGRGCTLSSLGYQALTRPKSFHLRR